MCPSQRLAAEVSPLDLVHRAGQLLAILPNLPSSKAHEQLSAAPDLPATLHALVSILGRNQDQQDDAYSQLEAAYGLIHDLKWEDEFEEREQLLSSVAFLMWNCCRRYRSYPETLRWESRVLEHVQEQTPTRDFLALEPSELSGDVLGRFLADPAVLLAVWGNIELKANQNPDRTLKAAGAIWVWLTSHRREVAGDDETVAYFEGRLALTLAMASAHVGKGREWEVWFSKAKLSLESVQNPGPYLAMVEFNRLGRLYIRRRYAEVVEQSGPLIERFRTLSMPAHELKVSFVLANSLKDGSYPAQQTLKVFKDTYRAAVRMGNVMLSASLASGLAQLHGKAGNQLLADCYAVLGLRLAERAACPWVSAYAISTRGELLRDRGAYLEAVNAYRAGAQVYAESHMYPFVAYTRVIIAETLLIAGREGDAIGELLLALPIIERESLIEEAEASVWLMRQAIKQRGIRPSMLRDLRERLAPPQ